jgi:hypothetical protein
MQTPTFVTAMAAALIPAATVLLSVIGWSRLSDSIVRGGGLGFSPLGVALRSAAMGAVTLTAVLAVCEFSGWRAAAQQRIDADAYRRAMEADIVRGAGDAPSPAKQEHQLLRDGHDGVYSYVYVPGKVAFIVARGRDGFLRHDQIFVRDGRRLRRCPGLTGECAQHALAAAIRTIAASGADRRKLERLAAAPSN